jgi:hypothetical protein
MAFRPESVSVRRALGPLALVLASLGAGCGKSDRHVAERLGAAGHFAQRGAGVPASAAAVIQGWSDALRAGHRRQAAAYWAHPSAMVNGVDAAGHLALIEIRSEHDALLADDSLSCGATLRRTERRGPYVQADFDLSLRSGPGASTSGCSGPASVEFVIRAGRIARWLRAPAGSPSTAPHAPARGSQPI